MNDAASRAPSPDTLQDVTRYAPVRVALSGICRLAVGAVPLFLSGVIVYSALHPRTAQARVDTPGVIYGAAAAFGIVGLLLFLGGIGRLVSAFERNCYLRAGPQGMALRMPRPRLFGRFTLVEYALPWADVEQIIHYTYRVNGIPMSTALQIKIRGVKGPLTIERTYFRSSVSRLQMDLLAIQRAAGS